MSTEKYTRLLLKDKIPNEKDIAETVGEDILPLWRKLTDFIEKHYDFLPETVFGGKNYGWSIRYRKSGKTFCSLFPEHSAFTVLIVLGKKEVESALSIIDDFKSIVKDTIVNTPQLHDGKWLWIRAEQEITVEDIIKLLYIKRKTVRAKPCKTRREK